MELQTLLAAARGDGFNGHTIFWGNSVSTERPLYYNVISRHHPMTATLELPALAFSWSVAVGDPALEPPVIAHRQAITARGDLEGDGLVWILQLDESGLDAPQFDTIWRHRAHGPGRLRRVVPCGSARRSERSCR